MFSASSEDSECPYVTNVKLEAHAPTTVSTMTRSAPSAAPTRTSSFFRSELQVLIERQYRTQPYKILIGHSDGGRFALHTLLHAPDTFDAYIALSPAVWSDDGVFVGACGRR